MREARLSVAAAGPRTLCEKVRAAVTSIGGQLVDRAACRQLLGGAAAAGTVDVLVTDAADKGSARATDVLRPLIANSGVAVIAVVPVGRARLRAELLEIGAGDVIAPSLGVGEIAQRIRRVAEAGALARRVRLQDGELVLIDSLARRLAGSPHTSSLLENALSGLGRSIGLAAAEIRVLAAPWRVDAEAAVIIGWSEQRGLTRTSQVALDPLDLLALRSSAPVPIDPAEGDEVALPLLARGQALAVLRATPRPGDRLAQESVRTLYVIGSLLAGAMEHAEQLASLQGHSKNLEAQVAERARDAETHRLLFQAVVDALPVSLHAIDRAFRVVVWNRGREAGPFGRPRGEVLGQNLFSVIGEDEALRQEFLDVLESGLQKVSEVEGRAETPPRLYQVEKIPMRLGCGDEVTHVITVSRDMTEHRALERSMARTEKMAAVGRLAAGVAHEINNPLATIAGCAEAMRGRLLAPLSDQDREEIRQDAVVIEEEAYRCKDILGSLLDFSRATPQEKGRCDLADVARRALKLLRHNPRLAGLRFELQVDPDAPPTCASGDQMVQVLLALLHNAADAVFPDGTVLVSTRRGQHGETLISVEDDGPGVPIELQDRIFEPFFTTKPPGQGTGLGLAVAYGLVEAQGGRLEMSSRPGFGARFDVVMPAHKDSPVEVGHE